MYYFSVEGETEQWYLKWLQDVINDTEESAYKVSFDCPVQKNPYKRAKTFIVLKTENKKVDIYHLSDYESDEPIHVQQFTETMDNMKKANEAGKYINYKFGYSNLTFDLWIILHKADCNGAVSHRKNYIAPINRAYEESFESMDEYKLRIISRDALANCSFPMSLLPLIVQRLLCKRTGIMIILSISIKDISIIKKIRLWLSGRQLRKYLRIAGCTECL